MIQDILFQSCKRRLVQSATMTDPGRIRFITVQYLCSFSRISPYDMAVSLANDGFEILFDNSAIGKSEREAERRKFNRSLKEAQQL